MPDLPPIGVRAVVEGYDAYNKNLEGIQKATSKASKAIQSSTTSQGAAISKALDLVASKMGGFAGQVAKFAQQAQGAQAQISALFSGLPAGTQALVAGAAAATAFAAAFVALGQRGAALTGITQSFDALNQRLGVDAVAALARLRTAAAGTVADMELLRLSNLALAGAEGKFGTEFAANLSKLLEIARVQARATGQDVGFLFQSLITGIKRGSPLLIDNTGLVLAEGKANEAYAASLGKTVEQLTAEEKQIALLNATIAAGQTAIDTFGSVQEGAGEKLARMNAIITNMLDTMAIGVQPAFGMFLDVINRVLGMVQTLVTAITPLISSFLEMGAAIITGPLQAILAIGEPIVKLIGWFMTFATVLLQPVMRAITSVFTAIGTGVQRVVDFVGGIFQQFGLTFDTMALSVGVGAGAIIAAMGNAMLQAYNAVVAPVVLYIATAIADFLVGQSPPPKGPLSQIDKGGAATMMAWMEGFSGVSLAPVAQVAADVSATLGTIGQFTMPQVEGRIAMLDQALQPFNDQLEIVKANFEAISTPAEAAMDAIDRQMEKAQEALAAGKEGSAEMVRSLDLQREKIQSAVAAQQALLDQATIQQALAKSQQAPERALLAIQQARLKALETKPSKEAKDAAAAAKAGEPPKAADVAGGGAGGAFDMGLPSVADLVSGQSAVDQMGSDLATGFQAGFSGSINQGSLKEFQNNQTAIDKQMSRIGQANIGQRIADAFTGISTSIQGALNEASTVISDWVGSITDPGREGSIPYSFNALMSGDWSGLAQSLSAPFETLATNVGTAVSDAVAYLSDPANEDSIVSAINSLAEFAPVYFQPLITAFADNFGVIRDNIMLWLDETFNPENINSIPGTLALLPTRVENALRDLGDSFSNSVLIPIQDTITNVGIAVGNFFTGTGEGTLKGMLDAGVAWFIELPQRIFNALASLGAVFFNVFVTPMIAATNAAIGGIEQFINDALSGLGTLIGGLQGIADAIGLGDQLAEMTAGLASGITLPRISIPTPPAAVFPGARVGGVFGPGMLRVHRGEQLIANGASKLSVFPANVTRSLDAIASIMAQPRPLELAGAFAGGGGTTNNTTNNNSFNINNPPSAGNTAQQIAMMQSRRVGR